MGARRGHELHQAKRGDDVRHLLHYRHADVGKPAGALSARKNCQSRLTGNRGSILTWSGWWAGIVRTASLTGSFRAGLNLEWNKNSSSELKAKNREES